MKYSKELTDKICNFIKIGVPNKYAALAVGISEQIFYKWKQDRVEFFESVREAEGLRVAGLIHELRQAHTPIGIMWILERVARDALGSPKTLDEQALLDRIKAIEEKLAEAKQ